MSFRLLSIVPLSSLLFFIYQTFMDSLEALGVGDKDKMGTPALGDLLDQRSRGKRTVNRCQEITTARRAAPSPASQLHFQTLGQMFSSQQNRGATMGNALKSERR